MKINIGDLIQIIPNRMDDIGQYRNWGLYEKFGVVTKELPNLMCEVLVNNRLYKIPKEYLKKSIKNHGENV